MELEAFHRTHMYLVDHTDAPVRRLLMDEVDWSHRMIGLRGTRGVGKTTFLLQYAKEHFDRLDRSCLYVNMNNFYFQGHSICDFAEEFYLKGGRTLLIDQVFKKPGWSKELRACYDKFPHLKIVFSGSSVLIPEEDYPELKDIVKTYNIRGFSFREYLNLHTGTKFHPYTLNEIVNNHEHIVKEILPFVRPSEHFQDYIHHGFYPFHLEHRNFSENLLKTMNMMTEVDILFIKQIELKYLSKIKKLFYLLALDGSKAPNVSLLAQEIETSRATVMNYMKCLNDARLINLIYKKGQQFPKKPSKVMMHNTNLMYAIYPINVERQNLMETFFVNTMWKDHKISFDGKEGMFLVDSTKKYRICEADRMSKARISPDVIYARYGTEIGHDNQIPLWLLGFLF